MPTCTAISIAEEHTRGQLFSETSAASCRATRRAKSSASTRAARSSAIRSSLVQYLDYKTYLPGDILTKVDRASMAHSLEVRTPFLDYEFVEWASQLPSSVKLRGSEGKHILKRALEPVLPREVLYPHQDGLRRAAGHVVPRLAAESHRRRGARRTARGLRHLRPPTMLVRVVDDHHSGRRDHSAILWSLLMFDGSCASRPSRRTQPIRRDCAPLLMTPASAHRQRLLSRCRIRDHARRMACSSPNGWRRCRSTPTCMCATGALYAGAAHPARVGARVRAAAQEHARSSTRRCSMSRACSSSPTRCGWIAPSRVASRKLHAQQPIDAIDAHFGYPEGAACLRIARRLGIPVFITIRGFENEFVKRPASDRSSSRRCARRPAASASVIR